MPWSINWTTAPAGAEVVGAFVARHLTVALCVAVGVPTTRELVLTTNVNEPLSVLAK